MKSKKKIEKRIQRRKNHLSDHPRPGLWAYFVRHFRKVLKLFGHLSAADDKISAAKTEKQLRKSKELITKAKLLSELAVRFAVAYLKNNSPATLRILDKTTELMVALSDAYMYPPWLQRKLLIEAEKAADELKEEFYSFVLQHPNTLWTEKHPLVKTFYLMDVSSKEQFKSFLEQAEKYTVQLYDRQYPLKAFAAANALYLLAEEILPLISKRVDSLPALPPLRVRQKLYPGDL